MKYLPKFLQKLAAATQLPEQEVIVREQLYFLMTFLSIFTALLIIVFDLTLIMFATGFGHWKPEWDSEAFAVLTIFFFAQSIYIYWAYTKFKGKVYDLYKIGKPEEQRGGGG